MFKLTNGLGQLKLQSLSVQEAWKLACKFKHQEAWKSFSSVICVVEQETKVLLSM